MPMQYEQPSSQAEHFGKCGYRWHGPRWNVQLGACTVGSTGFFLPLLTGGGSMIVSQPHTTGGIPDFFFGFGASVEAAFGGMFF